MKLILVALLGFLAGPALAELTYPVDLEEWKGRTARLNTATGEIAKDGRARGKDWPAADPDAYTCPVCGINPGFGPNIAPLRELPVPPKPVYDNNLYSLSRVEHLCGPDAGSLPAGCAGETDVIKTEWVLNPRENNEQKLKVQREAYRQLSLQIPEDEFGLLIAEQIGLLSRLADGNTLTPKRQTTFDENATRLNGIIWPIHDRKAELDAIIDDPDQELEDGEIESGWDGAQGQGRRR